MSRFKNPGVYPADMSYRWYAKGHYLPDMLSGVKDTIYWLSCSGKGHYLLDKLSGKGHYLPDKLSR